MGIVAEDIERVRAATDMVALVSERVALRRVGTRWVGLCPFHSEKTGSFSVNAELGVYYCFGCQARGDAITWLRELDHFDFTGAVEALAARANVVLRYDDDQMAGPSRKRQAELAEAMKAAVAWYHERLLGADDAATARGYLRRDRGYDGETVRRFRLGWAPDGWDTLVRQSGVRQELLVEAGLAFRNRAGRLTDSFRGRVLFPIYDAGGRAVGLGGRALPGAAPPKYKNTQGTALYDKSRVLYGLNWAKASIVERGQVVVCEGYTDVIGLHRAGITQAVATCGTALADGHVKLLVGFSRRIVLAYDADAAGQGAAEKFYDWEKRFDAQISVVSLPAGMDPAELAERDPEALRRAVEEASPYLGFRLQRLFASADLRNPEGRARAAEAAMALVAEHPDALVRDQYVMHVSDQCNLSPERLRALVPPQRHGSDAMSPDALRGGRPDDRRGAGLRAASRGRTGPGLEAGYTPPGLQRDYTDHSRAGAPAPAGPGGGGRAGARRKQPAVPLPEIEALRLAVHRPQLVAERVHPALFLSELSRQAFEQLASSMTLHDAIDQAPPGVADLLAQLAVADSEEDPDDVMRRLLDRAASAELVQLRRHARASVGVGTGGSGTGSELVALSERAAGLQRALSRLRAAEPGAVAGPPMTEAEAELLALLVGSPSVSPGPAA